MEETLRHVKFLARFWKSGGVRYAIITVLLELRVPSKCVGFDYLKNAIFCYLEDPTQTITKGIYPSVAALYDNHIDGTQVESAIRSAINKAWRSRDDAVWIRYFPPDANGSINRPSNLEFVSRIARVIELWKGCCEAYEQQSGK